MLKKWQYLPPVLQNKYIKPYYEILNKKKFNLFVKRVLDILFSLLLLILAIPFILIIGFIIVLDSPGSPLFLQERVTKYGKRFRIVKFRTMIDDADHKGTEVTVSADPRITKIGNFLRKFRLDEVPQLINILLGQMTFVGTRPEVPNYVQHYTPEMLATLLLPAGVTSRTSIEFRNEQELLKDAIDIDKVYIEQILPEKMKINLAYIKDFSLKEDLSIILLTIKKVFLSKSD